jgi:hypothetical protein
VDATLVPAHAEQQVTVSFAVEDDLAFDLPVSISISRIIGDDILNNLAIGV